MNWDSTTNGNWRAQAVFLGVGLEGVKVADCAETEDNKMSGNKNWIGF